jgi:putative transcriptional regulator
MSKKGNLREALGMYENPLGKKRSKFGCFIDKNSISQTTLSKKSGVSKSTISRLCHPEEYQPNMQNAIRIINALKDAGYDVDFDSFWKIN